MTVCASSTESNASTESTSSRTREPNDSTNGFCQGEPGSMKLRPAPPKRHQSRSGVRGHLGAVVHPHELRAGAALADDLVEHADGVVGVDRAGDPDRQGLAGVLVDDVEQLQRAAVGRGVELEVQRPDVVRPLRPQPLRRAPSSRRAGAACASAAAPAGPPRATAAGSSCGSPPSPPHGQRPRRAGSPSADARPTASAAAPAARRRDRRRDAGWWRWVERCCPVIWHARRSDSPRPLAQHLHGLASARRAHQFPFAISFSA